MKVLFWRDNQVKHSPFIMVWRGTFQRRVGSHMQTCYSFRFHYITRTEGRRTEKLKTVQQPIQRFSLSSLFGNIPLFPHIIHSSWPHPPPPIPLTLTQTQTPCSSLKVLCCLNVVGWLRNLLTRSFAHHPPRRLPEIKEKSHAGLGEPLHCARVCAVRFILNVEGFGVHIHCKLQFSVCIR